MLRPDFTTLKIFLSIVNLGNISKAAEHEHIAPSAISKRIQALEAETGTILFYRHARGMTATPAGQVLARHVVQLLDNVNRLSSDLSGFATGVRGQVRIHAHTSAVVQYLPGHIKRFMEMYPEVTVDLQEESSSQVIQSTVDGVTDIGIFGGNMDTPETLTVFECHRDRLGVLLPCSNELAKQAGIQLKELRDCPYISLESGSSLQMMLSEAAQKAGITLNTRIKVKTFEAAVRMVEAGLGAAIIPMKVFRPSAKSAEVRHVPLLDKWAVRTHLLGVRDPDLLTTAASLFLKHLLSSKQTKASRNKSARVSS